MNEKSDPYFKERLERGRSHRVIRSIEKNSRHLPETESNKELPHPAIEGTIEEFGWSEKSVDNIIHAFESGRINIKPLESDRMRIEFLPITELPEHLGHVSEISTIRKNLGGGITFGSPESGKFTYLQTVDFAVEGYIDDESEGREYGRVYVDSKKLSEKRNVYLDPESLHITDYEYGYSYCVLGGVPSESIIKIDVIKARKISHGKSGGDIDTDDWLEKEDAEQYMEGQSKRLREYLKKSLGIRGR